MHAYTLKIDLLLQIQITRIKQEVKAINDSFETAGSEITGNFRISFVYTRVLQLAVSDKERFLINLHLGPKFILIAKE